MGKRIVVVSDLHVGSSVGLWPEAHQVEGGARVLGSKYQKWLLRCWHDLITTVEKMTDPPLLVLNGDIVQGVNAKDGQLITNVVSVQAEAAEALLRRLVRACREVWYIRGTGFHEGRASEYVEGLAKALGCKQKTTTGQYTHFELYLSLEGRAIHFAHHVGVSSIPHYESTVPARDALMLLAELVRFFGAKAPNLQMVVRSHRHRYVQVHLPPNLTAVVTPSFQLRTEFAYKKATAMLPEIGWIAIESTPERLIATPHIYPLPPLKVQEVG